MKNNPEINNFPEKKDKKRVFVDRLRQKINKSHLSEKRKIAASLMLEKEFNLTHLKFSKKDIKELSLEEWRSMQKYLLEKVNRIIDFDQLDQKNTEDRDAWYEKAADKLVEGIDYLDKKGEALQDKLQNLASSARDNIPFAATAMDMVISGGGKVEGFWDKTFGGLAEWAGKKAESVSKDWAMTFFDKLALEYPEYGSICKVLSGASEASGELFAGTGQMIKDPTSLLLVIGVDTKTGRWSAKTALLTIKEMSKALLATEEINKGEYARASGKISINVLSAIILKKVGKKTLSPLLKNKAAKVSKSSVVTSHLDDLRKSKLSSKEGKMVSKLKNLKEGIKESELVSKIDENLKTIKEGKQTNVVAEIVKKEADIIDLSKKQLSNVELVASKPKTEILQTILEKTSDVVVKANKKALAARMLMGSGLSQMASNKSDTEKETPILSLNEKLEKHEEKVEKSEKSAQRIERPQEKDLKDEEKIIKPDMDDSEKTVKAKKVMEKVEKVEVVKDSGELSYRRILSLSSFAMLEDLVNCDQILDDFQGLTYKSGDWKSWNNKLLSHFDFSKKQLDVMDAEQKMEMVQHFQELIKAEGNFKMSCDGKFGPSSLANFENLATFPFWILGERKEYFLGKRAA